MSDVTTSLNRHYVNKRYYVYDGIFCFSFPSFDLKDVKLPLLGEFSSKKKAISFARSLLNDYVFSCPPESFSFIEDYLFQPSSSFFYCHHFVIQRPCNVVFSVSVVGFCDEVTHAKAVMDDNGNITKIVLID